MAQCIELTAEMRRMRDTMRSLWQDQYLAKVAPWQDAIERVAKERKVSTLQATVKMAKVIDNDHAVILLVAAAVETIEPSIGNRGEE